MKNWLTQQSTQRIGLFIVLVLGIIGAGVWYFLSEDNVAGAPAKAPLSAVIGDNTNAPKMVVYTDVLCDKCKEYHEKTLKKVIAEYANKGKLQLDIRPIAIVSERSSNITELTMCAHDQEAFLPALDYINNDLYNDASVSAEKQAATFFKRHSFSKIASALNVDEAQLASCKTERRYDETIAEADRQAAQAGVASTPMTFIKSSEPVRGFAQYSYIRSLIEMM